MAARRLAAYPEDLKIRVVEGVEWGGQRPVDVARSHGLRDGTVRQWLKRYRDRGGAWR